VASEELVSDVVNTKQTNVHIELDSLADDVTVEETNVHTELDSLADDVTVEDVVLGIETIRSLFREAANHEQLMLLKVVREGLLGFQWKTRKGKYLAVKTVTKMIQNEFNKLMQRMSSKSSSSSDGGHPAVEVDKNNQEKLCVALGLQNDAEPEVAVTDAVPGAVSGVVPDAEPVTEPEVEPVAEPVAEPEVEPVAEPVAEPEVEPVAVTDAVPGAVLDAVPAEVVPEAVPDDNAAAVIPTVDFSAYSLNQSVSFHLRGFISAEDFQGSTTFAVQLVNSFAIECTIVKFVKDGVILWIESFELLIYVDAALWAQFVVPELEVLTTLRVGEMKETEEETYGTLKPLVQQTDQVCQFRTFHGDNLFSDVATFSGQIENA
jgi:hypothetical protein